MLDFLERQLFGLDDTFEYVDCMSIESWVAHLVVFSDQGQEKWVLLPHLSRKEWRVSFHDC